MRFQCSSASRKFLNLVVVSARSRAAARVSVLFSEPKIPQSRVVYCARSRSSEVSVLFSEPKIPQSIAVRAVVAAVGQVSVLFSEPKIPQS